MDDMLHRLIMFLTQIIQVIILAAGCYFWGVSVYGWKRKRKSLHTQSLASDSRSDRRTQ